MALNPVPALRHLTQYYYYFVTKWSPQIFHTPRLCSDHDQSPICPCIFGTICIFDASKLCSSGLATPTCVGSMVSNRTAKMIRHLQQVAFTLLLPLPTSMLLFTLIGFNAVSNCCTAIMPLFMDANHLFIYYSLA